MMSETVSHARGTVMAVNLVGFGVGRSVGAALSTFVYTHSGFPVVTLLAAGFNLLAIMALAEMQGKITLVPRLLAWRRTLGSKNDTDTTGLP